MEEIREKSERLKPKREARQKVAEQITRLLDAKEGSLEEGPKIRLYRVLYGGEIRRGEEWRRTGFSERELKQRGVFLRNFSPLQHEKRLERYASRTDEPEKRRVHGLPVFLALEPAITWLEERRYDHHPALGILEVPLNSFSEGILKLRRNLADPKQDFEITVSDMEKHVAGGKLISGECYLIKGETARVPEEIRRYERILVPTKLKPDGTIDFSAGFREV